MLNIGDIIYYVHEDSNLGSRKKIRKTDKNGVEWYRYDRPMREWQIIEYRIKGILETHIQGELVSYDDCYTDGEILYHLESVDSELVETIFSADDVEENRFFISKKSAESCILELENQQRIDECE